MQHEWSLWCTSIGANSKILLSPQKMELRYWWEHGNEKNTQPLDLTTNGSVKKMEKRGFSDYFTSTITETLEKDPQRDVTTIEVDLKLSTLKPIHAKLLMSIYEFLQGEKGRKIILNGWKAAGITEAVESARKGRIPTQDPFMP
ncbi:hypothetical protein AWC38_SpisGene24750 [Stylophora pistillata]|uniref:Uncharacterized protein n=1 Tax=Stylophora pistillata TaxID=50429 RepID=A0A2B4R3Y2_STYPI|nr:hypothetical protein AWC38_SpisGene24750 [Stylophora pistillata]